MVYVHLAEGFEEIEAVTIVDVLRRGGIEAASVSVTGSKTIRGAHGISVCADKLFAEADYIECEMIVLPGGMPGTKNLLAHDGLTSKITSFAYDKKYLAAICAAPMVLGELGVLEGKNATIYPGMEKKLAGAKVSTDKVVMDGNIITSRGPGTAIEFALAIVDTLKGKDEAAKLRKALVTD